MKITKILFTLALLAVAGTASASGLYAGASIGSTSYKSGVSGTETGGKAFVGYQLTPVIGAEVDYVNLGSAHGVRSQGATADLTGRLPLGRLGVFGKVGVADMQLNGAANQGYQIGAHYGVGADYALTSKASLRVEAERFQKAGDATPTATPRANLYSAGLQYKF